MSLYFDNIFFKESGIMQYLLKNVPDTAS